ncbi:MAG: GNAT family N-acetyltransferase [Haloarculaceae archaeon]
MDIRKATAADSPAIRDIARRSLQASYSLSPQAITTAVEKWYGEMDLEERLDEEGHLYLVAERDGQPVGFSESRLSEDGAATLLWLHVDPAYRGEGVADALLSETHERLEAAGGDRLYGRVLQDNADGNAFYEAQGFEQVARDEVEIGNRTYVENVWAPSESTGLQPVDAGGRTVYVDRDEYESGSAANFHVVYTDESRSDKYGYYCGNCDELANAMDAMGRVECNSCGNTRKPTRWDAAYL